MQKKKVTLFIILLVSLNFFRFNAIREIIYIVLDTIVFCHILIWLNKKTNNRFLKAPQVTSTIKKNFIGPFKLMLLGIAISFIPAYFYHDQAFYYSYGISRSFGYILLYSYLHRRKIKISDIEDVIIIIGFMFQIIYWIEIKFPNSSPLFGEYWSEESSGLTRLMIWGRHTFMLSFCILLSRFKFSGKSVAMIMISFLSVLLLQTRQLLLPAGLVLLYHFRKIMFKSFISAFGLIILIAGGIYLSGDIFDKILDKTKAQSDNSSLGGDRIQSYIYFLQDPGADAFTRVFGKGYPAPTTKYGDEWKQFHDDSGLSAGDIGPVGYVTYYGYLWFIAVFVLLYRGFKIKVPSKYIYTKYYLFIVLLTLPVGEAQFISSASIVSLAIVFYIIDVGNTELLETKRAKMVQAQARILAATV